MSNEYEKVDSLRKLKYDKDWDTGDSMEFLSSLRGRYILAQALYKAIEAMSGVEENRRESSNIADMAQLLLSPMWAPFFSAMIPIDHEELLKQFKNTPPPEGEEE